MRKFFAALVLLLICFDCANSSAETNNDKGKINELEQKFIYCGTELEKKEQSCEEYFSTKCHYIFIDLNKKVQQCYKQILQEIFVSYYDLDAKSAEEKINTFTSFIYDEYFFMYTESKYCKENCGIAPYLYSEYATTYSLQTYIDKTIDELKSRS